MLRLRRPTAEDLALLVERQRGERVTYEGVGGTITGDVPAGYRHEQYDAVIGRGEDAFTDARDRLAHWRPHRGSGIQVAADGPIAEGTTVALAAPLPVGFAVAACRIVAVLDDSDRFGFAYGTLPAHPESGEELFVVERGRDGSVTFRISVFSRPHELLARLAAPAARLLQRRATRAYISAMRSVDE